MTIAAAAPNDGTIAVLEARLRANSSRRAEIGARRGELTLELLGAGAPGGPELQSLVDEDRRLTTEAENLSFAIDVANGTLRGSSKSSGSGARSPV